MYKYAKFSKYIVWCLVAICVYFGMFQNKNFVLLPCFLIAVALMLPVFFYKCKNCGVKVVGYPYSATWRPEERFRVCPKCGKNPTEISDIKTN